MFESVLGLLKTDSSKMIYTPNTQLQNTSQVFGKKKWKSVSAGN